MKLRRIFGLFISLLIFALVISNMAFGYLYLQKDEDNDSLESEISSLEDRIQNLERIDDAIEDSMVAPMADSTCSDNCLLTFEDSDLGASVVFPSSWNPEIEYVTSFDSDLSTGIFPAMTDYQMKFVKDSSNLRFVVLLGPVDGFPQGLLESEYEWVELESDILRYKLLSEDTWTYAALDDCSGSADLFPELVSADICVTQFYPGYADSKPTQVFVSPDNNEDLLQADEIVLSSL